MRLVKILMITAFVICIKTDVHPQQLLFTEFTYGQYVHHRDNDLGITDEENLKDSFGLTIGFQFKIKRSHSLRFQIGYHRSIVKKATSFLNYVIDPLGNTYFVEKPIDLSFHALPLDIQYAWSMHPYVNMCLGPSFTGDIRKITVHYIDYEGKEKAFVDRLFGIGVGIAGSIQLAIPLSQESRYCFISDIGFRYIRSFWFDEEGRELDDYDLSHTQYQISTGIGIRL